MEPNQIFTCPKCGKRLKVRANHSGATGTCPTCRSKITLAKNHETSETVVGDRKLQIHGMSRTSRPPWWQSGRQVLTRALIVLVVWILVTQAWRAGHSASDDDLAAKQDLQELNFLRSKVQSLEQQRNDWYDRSKQLEVELANRIQQATKIPTEPTIPPTAPMPAEPTVPKAVPAQTQVVNAKEIKEDRRHAIITQAAKAVWDYDSKLRKRGLNSLWCKRLAAWERAKEAGDQSLYPQMSGQFDANTAYAEEHRFEIWIRTLQWPEEVGPALTVVVGGDSQTIKAFYELPLEILLSNDHDRIIQELVNRGCNRARCESVWGYAADYCKRVYEASFIVVLIAHNSDVVTELNWVRRHDDSWR